MSGPDYDERMPTPYGHPLLLMEVAFRLLVVQLALVLVPFSGLIARAARGRCWSGNPSRPGMLGNISYLARGLERRLFSRASCLRVSLVIFWMGGSGTALILGLPADGELDEAHAWVVHESEPLPVPEAGQYVELTRFQKAG